MAVECEDEFDKNFEHKAFFNDPPWAPVKVYNNIGSLMMRTGMLRKSLSYIPGTTDVRITSSLPYASIHNEGGVIDRVISMPVTDKMRRFFYAKFKQTGDNKYKAMYLTKKQTLTIRQKITIPKRQFVGDHPAIRQALSEIAKINLDEYAKQLTNTIKK